MLWFGRATPREWLEEKEEIRLALAPTAYGRVGFAIRSAVRSKGQVHVNLSLPRAWWGAQPGGYLGPPGGIRVRLRVPGPRRHIRRTRVGGAVWKPGLEGNDTLVFDAPRLAHGGDELRARLADVLVEF